MLLLRGFNLDLRPAALAAFRHVCPEIKPEREIRSNRDRVSQPEVIRNFVYICVCTYVWMF